MLRPLQEHIARLEEKIRVLSARSNDIDWTAADRFQVTVDLDLAERALDHFRKAYELEQKINSLENSS
jgi:hypothetical protein